QNRGRLLAGDDQHMRRVAWLIGLFVWHNLHPLLRRSAPPRTFARSPEERGGLDGAILRSDCGYANAELAGIGDGELDLCFATRVGLALRGSDRLSRAFAPVPASHLHSERRLYWFL